MTKRTRPGRAGWLLAVVALAAVAAGLGTGVRYAGPEHPLLLERATLVLRAADIKSPNRVPAAGSPGPGGTRTLFGVLRHDDRETVALWLEQAEVYRTPDGRARQFQAVPQAYRFNAGARTERPIEPMDSERRKWAWEDFRSYFDEFDSCYSPDGRWMISAVGQQGQPPFALMLSQADGVKQMRIPDSLGLILRRMAWLPDSSSWVEVAFDGDGATAREFDVTSARPVRVVRLAGPLPVSDVAGITPDHRLVLMQRDQAGEGDAPVTLVAFDLRASVPKPVRVGTVGVPGIRIMQLWLSPDNTRIAFVGEPFAAQPAAKPTLAERIMERVGLRRTKYGAGLWVGRLDGTGLREIGRLIAKSGGDAPYPTTVRWTPDGRDLTFVAQDAWYRVPAE